jgi:hypothetical protein
MSWTSSLRAGVVPRIQHLRRVNPATVRLASTSSSPTIVQPNIVSKPASSQQTAAPTSIKEELKNSLRRTAAQSEGAPVEDGLRILIFGKPVSYPLSCSNLACFIISPKHDRLFAFRDPERELYRRDLFRNTICILFPPETS